MAVAKTVLDSLGMNEFKTLLNSNKAIEKVGGSVPISAPHSVGFFGGLPGTVNRMRHRGEGFMEALNNTHRNQKGDLDYGKIAGSFMVAGVGYRALSGGGVYRDANGNTDVAGVPFI